jgi:hypothetical protein
MQLNCKKNAGSAGLLLPRIVCCMDYRTGSSDVVLTNEILLGSRWASRQDACVGMQARKENVSISKTGTSLWHVHLASLLARWWPFLIQTFSSALLCPVHLYAKNLAFVCIQGGWPLTNGNRSELLITAASPARSAPYWSSITTKFLRVSSEVVCTVFLRSFYSY